MARINHRALNIALPPGFSLVKPPGEEVLLQRDSDGKILANVPYYRLAVVKSEWERLARRYEN